MNHPTSSFVGAALLAATLGLFGAVAPAPLVALGAGPTFNTLGEVDGTEVVDIDGLPVFPTAGNLNMTTISVSPHPLTVFSALGYWASGDHQVVPRSQVYPPDRTIEQVREENTQAFAASELSAEAAAIARLGLPTRVVVGELVPDSPAQGALEVGDELLAVSGRRVDSPAAVSDALTGTAPGQTVTVTYRRAGEQRDAEVTLGAGADRGRGLLGVRPGVAPRDGEITISLGDIGGPSAGLMFALAVVDKLTPGELTGGRFVAGTGAITSEGVVEPIGGIPFKMSSARDAGATVFLVPANNCAEARATVPDGLQLVRVATLDEAVDGLDALRAGRPAPIC